MNKIKSFLENLLQKEAIMKSNHTVPNLEILNESVEEFEQLLHGNMTESLSVGRRTKLLPDAFYKVSIEYKKRHLFKLSNYEHKQYGELWVAYLSNPNPRREISKSAIDEAFIMALIDDGLKVIGTMSVGLSQSTMEITGWKKDMYNPSDLDVRKLGKFISTERFSEPKDDGFSLTDFLEDK